MHSSPSHRRFILEMLQNPESAFELWYQPRFNPSDQSLVGCESLLRWRFPPTRKTSINELLRIAEDSGLLPQLEQWIIQRALDDSIDWNRRGFSWLNVSVNITAFSLRQPDVIHALTEQWATRAANRRLELEITETHALLPSDIPIMHLLRSAGYRVAIDDFGDNPATLRLALSNAHIDTIKFSRDAVKNILSDTNPVRKKGETGIMRWIITLARSIADRIVFEGIETKDELALALLLGADEVQGFVFDPPLPKPVFQTRWLERVALRAYL